MAVAALSTLRLLLNPVVLALLSAFRLRLPCPVLSSISCKESPSLVRFCWVLPPLSFSTFLLLNPLLLLVLVSKGRRPVGIFWFDSIPRAHRVLYSYNFSWSNDSYSTSPISTCFTIHVSRLIPFIQNVSPRFIIAMASYFQPSETKGWW